MNFFRSKLVNMLKYRQNSTSAKRTVENLLVSSKDNVDLDVLEKLAELSFDSNQYSELFTFLIDNITEFSYQEKIIKKTLKIITILSHLLKTGNSSLSKDLANNTDILQRFQKLNSHYFELTHPMNTKQLEYKLQLIKQRARFMIMLLKDEQLLQRERSKLVIRNGQQSSEPMEAETAFGLKIDGQKQKQFVSKIKVIQSVEEASANYFQNEEMNHPTTINHSYKNVSL